MTETNGTKAKDLESIFIECWPEYEGHRVSSDKRCKDDVHKMTFSIPAPTTEAELQEIFNIAGHENWSAQTFFTDKGVIQHVYGENSVTKLIVDSVAEGQDPNESEFIEKCRLEMEEALQYDPEKGRKKADPKDKARAKEMKAAEEETGLSSAELIALAKEKLAEKASD